MGMGDHRGTGPTAGSDTEANMALVKGLLVVEQGVDGG